MATNHTENYNLNQWEPDDAVERLDFNADNAAIEQALSAHDQTLGEQAASIAALLADVAQCYDPGNPTFVTGTYTGNFSKPATDNTGGGQTIELGFCPSFVLVYRFQMDHIGCAAQGQNLYWNATDKAKPLIEMLPTGFRVYNQYMRDGSWYDPELNRSGWQYGYLAMK